MTGRDRAALRRWALELAIVAAVVVATVYAAGTVPA
jgi:hypothetical protein